MNTTSTNQKKIREALNGNDSVIPASRIYALSLAGYTQARIAEVADVSAATVNQVIHDKRTSRNVATVIASVLNTPLSRIWPDGRYSNTETEESAA